VRADQYVNLSTNQFVASLEMFALEWRRRPILSESEANTQAEDLRWALIAVDPTAFVDPDSWWSAVMDQLLAGPI